MGKDAIPQPSCCPQKTLQILHMALSSPMGSSLAVSLVEAPGTEVLGSLHALPWSQLGAPEQPVGWERPWLASGCPSGMLP